MKHTDIYTNIDCYLAYVGDGRLSAEAVPCPAPACSDIIAAALGEKQTHNPVTNYIRFKKTAKKLQASLGLPFVPRLFWKRLPSPGYYVHKKSLYFSRPGVYISAQCLGSFPSAMRLAVHELCHYCISTSSVGADIFRITRQLQTELAARGAGEEGSDLFALYPTEYFALCLEREVTRDLAVAFPVFGEAVRLEEERLRRAVLKYRLYAKKKDE